ncbi:MAG: PAS domain S-box protein [Desulfomonilaceae bacterium]|nr:PAS domain S-box protein [Desulfomonilaceae bacterium]
MTGLKLLAGDDPHRYEDMFGMFIESIPSSVLLINRELRVIFANHNFITKSRRSQQEVIGQKLEQVLPEAIIEHIDITSKVREVFAKNQAIRGDRMTYRAPGIPIRTYYYSILPFAWRGDVENIILLLDDVTEQVRLSEEVRRVERHLAGVVESARDVVLSTDSEGVVLTWNTAAERLTDYPSWQVKGKSFFERCVPEASEALRNVFNQLRIVDSPQTGEWDVLTRNGNKIPISWVFSSMEDERGEPVGVVAVGRDLSEHRKLEMQLLQSQKLAALGVMAGGIAHEIRNPLAVCSSAAQFLKNPDIQHGFREECVSRILDGIHKASSIIENLLRFARPSSSLEMNPVNIVDVIEDALQLVSNQAKIGKIGVKADLPKEPMAVYGNGNLLQQMFVNLLLNAFNSMPEGGSLTVSLRSGSEGALISIEDSGCGIAPEHLGKIFDPFFTLSPVGKGTGLGLSICYSIVRQHMGNIEVQSIEGEGTVFTVYLPLL